ncbi:hypothetical protein LTR08_006502 [Meristemomyces frigidus]|nr:hypothetical protein LTR08_006502 [Meristemomyces frigidus]
MDDSALDEATVMPDAGDASMLDNMDDLFGDAADGLGMGTGVVLPSAPLPASLIFRVASAQRTGCCTKLVWSNTGSIAQISKDGSKIFFRTMFRDQTTSAYGLSEESQHPVNAPEGRQFVHLQFSGLGVDLAALDHHGGVHLYTVAGATGRMQLLPCDKELLKRDGTDLDAVVPYITPATNTGKKWVTQMRHPDQQATRVHHPAENRNALLHVTMNGKLALLYQNDVGVWQVVYAELEGWSTSEQLISHAAFGEGGDHLILVTHTEARRLRLYKIAITWNGSQQSRGNVQYVPTLAIGHMTMLEYVAPQHSDIARLSLLRVVSRLPDIVDESSPNATTVLAVFTHAPIPNNDLLQQQDAFSVIARWTIESTVPNLHASFTKLKASGPTPVQSAVTVLRRQSDLISGKLILTVGIQYHSTALAFGASDGTIEFRDRSTWGLVESYGDTTTVSSLPQSGFGCFPGEQISLLAHSPDGSATATAKADGKLVVKTMTLLSGWQALDDGISDNRGLVETAIVCLARQYARLCSSNISSDECLALLPPELAPKLRLFFIKQIIKIMCRYIDVSMLDQQKQQRGVLSEPLLSRAMSAQLVLGARPGSVERTFGGQFAYCFLNLRAISMAVAQSLNRESVAANRSDVLASLAGVMRWSIDMTLYIIDSIAQIKRDMQPGVSAKQAVERFVAETGNPSVHLLLCSFPRVLLRLQIISTPQYLKLVQLAIPRANSLDERQQLQGIYELARTIPFSFAAFPELIAETDNAVRSAYTEAGSSGERRMEMELAMMTEGHIPDELQPALVTLMDTILPKLCESADMGKLYFWDTYWLGIDRAVPADSAKRYDAIRKTPLNSNMRLRVCRRCGAQTEDIPQGQVRQLPPWLNHAQRQCYCQNYWWLE